MSDQVDECLAGGAESLAKMQRAERLMRARKAALSIGMDRISEKDSLHRSLRHSSVRAEVTHLTEQSRAKDNELKEARLYIQRLEQKAQNQRDALETDQKAEVKLQSELKKKLQNLQLKACEQQEVVKAESTRLLHLLNGVERQLELMMQSPDAEKVTAASSQRSKISEARSILSLILKVRHGLENLRSDAGHVGRQVEGEAKSDALNTDMRNSSSSTVPASDIAADAGVSRRRNVPETKPKGGYPNPQQSAKEFLLSKDSTFIPSSNGSDGPNILLDHLLDMCRHLDEENLLLQKRCEKAEMASQSVAAPHHVQGLISKYRSVILRLQKDVENATNSLETEKELTFTLKRQLLALQRQSHSDPPLAHVSIRKPSAVPQKLATNSPARSEIQGSDKIQIQIQSNSSSNSNSNSRKSLDSLQAGSHSRSAPTNSPLRFSTHSEASTAENAADALQTKESAQDISQDSDKSIDEVAARVKKDLQVIDLEIDDLQKQLLKIHEAKTGTTTARML